MKKRLAWLALFVFTLFGLLISHYFKIQILEREKWTRQALAQHEFIIKEPARRGSFFAHTALRYGHLACCQPLVFDVTKFHLYIDPLALPQQYKDEISERLVQFGSIEDSCRQEFELKSHSRCLARWLEKETKEAILAWWLSFAKAHKIAPNALYFVADNQRCYPYKSLAGQVLHTIRDMKDEITNEGVPTGGLEAYFNDTLKGKQGKRKLLRSPLNPLEIDKVIDKPIDGADIYLTIDHYIQAIVEEELKNGVLAARAKGGWAVMMDPHNGEILALAQYPFFDPSDYRSYFNDPERIEETKVKSITDCFEVGSIMKPITVAIGLKANEELISLNKEPLFDPEGPIDTQRSIFPGRSAYPLIDRPGHKQLNMYMAIQKSSNVYMAQIIDKVISVMGAEWYRKQLVETFGFGQKSGIELPAETIGLVPRFGKCHPNGALEWSLPTPYSLAMGYNILATSLQMVRAYALFANGGYLVEPTLIKEIRQDGNVLFRHQNKQCMRVLQPSVAKEVVRAMKFTTKPGGTATVADINGYTEAGKTGTAEKIVNGIYAKQRHTSSFLGFVPANKPRFVLIVTIDDPKYSVQGGIKGHMGGRCAGPVFREISKSTLHYLGIPPDDPHGYPSHDIRFDREKADWLKEVDALKILYNKWNTSS